MSLDVGRYRLMSAHQSLLAGWEETRLAWQDLVRGIRQRTPRTPDAVAANHLGRHRSVGPGIRRMRQECSE